MQTQRAQIKKNGDVTLPEDIRRRFGEDVVEFVIRDDGVVELRRPTLSLDDVFGILPPLDYGSIDFEEEIERAMEEHALEKYKRLSR